MVPILFYAYDTKGNYVSKSITVSTIENTVDSASCTLNVKVKSSSIIVNATILNQVLVITVIMEQII